MSIVLALAVVAVVISAAPRRRRRTPGTAAATFEPLRRHVPAAIKGLLAALAAGAVLLLFGQQASAQADAPPEPPPVVAPTPGDNGSPTDEIAVPPAPNDPAEVSDGPVAPPVEPVADEASDDAPVADTPEAPAPPSVPTPPIDASATPPDPLTPPVLPTADATGPTPPPAVPPTAVPPPPSVSPIEPPAVAGTAPREVDLGLWNVTLRGRAMVRSNGATISIHFDNDGTELMRAVADVSEIVVTGSDGDDSLEVSDGIGVRVRYDGGGGIDALVMPASGGTARLTGSRTGEVFGRSGALLVSFANVDDLIGGPGPDTFVADRTADLRSLDMGPEDRLVVDLGHGPDGADANVLTVESAHLDGTLEVTGGPTSGLLDSAPVSFLSFGTASGDFTTFRGLDLGGGGYVRPTNVAGGYELRSGRLPDEIVIRFPSASDADEFFTFLSGKGDAFRAGTPVTIQLSGGELTGNLTVSGTPESAILDLTDVRLHLGSSDDSLLTLEADAATLTLTDSELTGTLEGSLTTTVPDVSFTGTFRVALDSDDRSIAAVGNHVTVTVAGVTFDDVDLVVTVTGEGAGMALVITTVNGEAVTIPRTGASNEHAASLADALQRGLGAPLGPMTDASASGALSVSPPRFGTVAASPESAAHVSGALLTKAARPALAAGDALWAALLTPSPLLALVGVAGPLVVAASSAGARGGSSRAEPTPIGETSVPAPVIASPDIARVLVDEPFLLGASLATASARGPPERGAPAMTSEILVHRTTASPQRIPGAQGPFLVTTARRATAASVESGWVDRAPGLLLSLFVLLFLLWTRGRRSTRPSGPCRRRARPSLFAKGDAGGVTGGSWRRRRCGHRRRHAHRSSQRPVRADRSLRAAQLEGGRSAMSDAWSCTAHRSSRRGWCSAGIPRHAESHRDRTPVRR